MCIFVLRKVWLYRFICPFYLGHVRCDNGCPKWPQRSTTAERRREKRSWKQNYFCIDTNGDFDTKEFTDKVQDLYTFSYKSKILLLKKEIIATGYGDYVVYPLERIQDESSYKIMIRQPDFFNDELFNKLKEKMDFDYSNDLYFQVKEEHSVVQMLHIGSFDQEEQTFNKMKEFIKDSEYEIKTLSNQEIYLSDFRKTKTENLKTILRYEIDIKK